MMDSVESLLQSSSASVQFRKMTLDQAIAAERHLAQRGIVVRSVMQDAATSAGEVLQAIATAFTFPSYFAGNWDALEECLCDLDWLPAQGYILVIHDARQCWTQAYSDMGRLTEIWVATATEWVRKGIPFHLIFADPMMGRVS